MDVTLRPWRPDDADALRPLLDDPQIRRSTRALDAAAWLAAQHDDGRHAFAVERAGDLVGNVVLKMPEAEVGYWTAAHARGQGVASQALRQLTSWAFTEFAMPALALVHQVDNAASCAVARHCGYLFERELPPGGGYPHPGHRHVRHRAG
jgi:RimJ/RimL family protein N-acetyltransferase